MSRPEPVHFRAAVFDLDGTLADNMSLHGEAFDVFAVKHGLPPLTKNVRRQIDGRRNSEIFPILFGREVFGDECRALERDKEGTYRELSRRRVRPTSGAALLLDRLAALGIGVAVATSAPEENVVHTLAELGFTERFPVIVRSDQVPRGKPAPDVFLEAARRLGVPAIECLAFEDAPVGITAARDAGMWCVGITTTFTPADFAAAVPPPNETYSDFRAFLEGSGRWLIEAGELAI